jgi:hypothetical protein
MAIVTVDPECPRMVRRVRRVIRKHLGEEAATVFSEAVANVREHGGQEPARLVLHRHSFALENTAAKDVHRETGKPSGEGGYGLQIIERMGAIFDTHERYCCVRWRLPNH